MRSLTRHDQDERGAVLVWVALMLVVLLGIGALVIDVGALYAERRQLQNGADAAALAVADGLRRGRLQGRRWHAADDLRRRERQRRRRQRRRGVRLGPGPADCATTPPPGTAGASGWVQVTTSTHNPANSDRHEVKFLLAPVLDAANVGRTVHASAVAAWGPVGGATTFPFTFSVCEFEHLGGSLDGT